MIVEYLNSEWRPYTSKKKAKEQITYTTEQNQPITDEGEQ